jgi:hypothetical protein
MTSRGLSVFQCRVRHSQVSPPQRGLACLSIRDVAGPSDDEIEAMTIGGAVVHNGPIHLAEYDPSWPVLFSRETARGSRGAVGVAVAIQVHPAGGAEPPFITVSRT